MTNAKKPGGPAKPSRSKGDWQPGQGPDEPETAGLPREASGDPRTLVGVDNPDDVDLYRHDGPPPGFERASPAREKPRLRKAGAPQAGDERNACQTPNPGRTPPNRRGRNGPEG